MYNSRYVIFVEKCTLHRMLSFFTERNIKRTRGAIVERIYFYYVTRLMQQKCLLKRKDITLRLTSDIFVNCPYVNFLKITLFTPKCFTGQFNHLKKF